jgi:DNA-binding MarR family transcriptional regulator
MNNYLNTKNSIVFTEKQGQYLAFIYAYTCINQRAPAESDMQRYFSVTPPTVHQMIVTLEKASLITRQPGVPRSIQLIVDPARLPTLAPPARKGSKSL